MEIEHVPFSIRDELDDVLSLFSDKIRQKRLQLAGFVADTVPSTLIGDPGRLRQVLMNLISNACKVRKFLC